jgi:LysR family nitrogen assimilation transcriptional regulator
MDIRQLKYFLAVASAKSLTKASERLHLAQPALSQQILRLEEEIGERLLLRHSRGVELTEAGARLESHARAILEQIDAACQDLRDFKGEPRGRIRLGMPRSASGLLVPGIFRELERRWPRVQLVLSEGLSEGMNQLLFEGRLDLALTFKREESKWITYDPLMSEKLCFLVRGAPPAQGRPFPTMSLQQVAKQPLVLPTLPHGVRELVEQAARKSGVKLHVSYEVDSVPVIIEMVEEGIGATVLPFGSFTKALGAGKLRAARIVTPEIERVLFLAHAAKATRSKAFVAVRELLCEQMALALKTHAPLKLLSAVV